MIIANYDEFIQVINSLFNADEISDYTSFAQSMAKSKTSRNIKRNRYQNELKQLKLQINECKQKLRQAERLENKREYSIELKKLNRIKQDLIKKNKAYSELNIFNEMSENAKVYACTRHLLSKYLPQALLEDLASLAKQNDDSSIIVNIQAFKDSRLYQDTAHIKDYILSYFENYPERIKGTRYFIGLHRKSPTLSDLLADINTYFEKLNSPSEKESNRIKKSHIGIKVIKTYPEKSLQMVQITTKAGLKYEGSVMHHCVGSYASRVEKGETQIYSLRNMGEANQELIPHATVEFKNGKITQIKGPHDSIISCEYVNTVRDMLLTLIKSKNFQDIINSESIPNADKNNIGIFKDTQNKIHDLFNFNEQNAVFDAITITEEALTALPLHKMKIKNLTYSGLISDEGLAKLLSLQGIENLHFKSLKYTGEVFDYSLMSLKDVYLDMEAPKLKQIILPPQTIYFSLNGNFDSLEHINLPQGIKEISLKGKFAKLHTLPEGVEELSLEGGFPSLTRLPDNITSLGLKGEFPELLNINTEILKNLSIESSDIVKKFTMHSMPNLRYLYLYGECVTGLEKLPQAPLLETLHVGSGNYELGKQYSNIGNNFTADYTHLKSLILNGTFPKIHKLDLSLNPELVEIEALGSKFEQLRILVFPNTLSTCILDFADLPKLEELDFSNINSKQLGKIESFNLGPLKFGNSHKARKDGSSHVKGISASFAHLNSLRTIKFPLCAEIVNLQNFSGVLHAKEFNFKELTKLKELNLSIIPFENIPHLDLSSCSELIDVCIDSNILNHTILPPSIEKLSIILAGENREMPEISLDSTTYKNLKTLVCTGFLPDSRLLKPSIENLTIHANNQKLENLTEINMENYKYVDMQLSGSDLSKLKKIVFPKCFKKMSLGDTSDNFTELDFSNTVGEVRIHQQGGIIDDNPKRSYFQVIRNVIVQEVNDEGHKFDNFLMLTDKQLQSIKHIKLGKDTCLLIYQRMPISADLTVDFAYDTPERAIKFMQEKNPQINFVQEQNSKKTENNFDKICNKCRN
ncbi:MAG: PcfJ domain-containing protein [Alphaproteobacteria bacterium]|nr:PcfJ domain-containing protein [Alphaproteobacteria bacterium]